MTSIRQEIEQLEEGLRQAELGPDPSWFEKHVDDRMLFVSDGKANAPKQQIVQAHTPGKGPKFTRVDMKDMNIIEQDNAAVVTCEGTFEGPQGTQTLKFMRVWVKKTEGWKIVAGAIF